MFGVDDFAYKKGQSHCTVIVNKQVRIVTRDRASAYAKAIAEELPDARQIADRFHLHQNLMSWVKDVLAENLPVHMKIPNILCQMQQQQVHEVDRYPIAFDSKKNEDIVPDSDSIYSKNELLRRKVYEEIRQLYDAGYSSRKIAKLLQVSRNTISKVLHGDINELCRNSRALMFDKHLAEIIKGINAGHTGKAIYQELKSDGKDPGGISNFYVYLKHIAKNLGLTLKKFRHQPVLLPDNTVPENDFDYLKRTGVFQYLWNESELTENRRKYLFEKYPVVPELRKRIWNSVRYLFVRIHLFYICS
ncbi:helix-turn-helix domain-containing protein [Propionispira raffinosivorans]|uniref:helix-turn-helix domain-containing protein n=1 Tax=Propionispira raffinosivorans TaxID=86959 RepID=UPI0003AA4F78|nr:helix-turn-helix domain-containing protein [Propionispira raffinosivorans]